METRLRALFFLFLGVTPPLGLMRTNWKQKEAVQNIIVLPLLIRKYSQPEQIIKSENISAIVQDLNYFIHHSIIEIVQRSQPL